MYQFVAEAEVKPYRSYCSKLLTQLRDRLYDEGINSQFVLVGSGGRNMVTRDGNGPFDLDYNLNILDAEEEYWENPNLLKNTVKKLYNQIFPCYSFSFAKNSTSVITAILYLPEGRQFSFDLAIITEDEDGHYLRLQCDKGNLLQNYIWNQVPDSRDLKKKVDFILAKKKWSLVRERYLFFKNQRTQHSFGCYAQAVNEVYMKLRNKK